MTSTFHYTPHSRQQPVLSLGGRFSRPRPLISVELIVPGRSKVVNALLDTGADDTVFPDSVAAYLGIDLSSAAIGGGQGVGGVRIPLRYVNLNLRIAGNNEQRDWPATVAFAPLPNQLPLLGFAGFLQYFTACFHGDLEFVELTTNALYPGT